MRTLALLSSLALFQISGAAPTIGSNVNNSTVSTTMAGGTADGFSGFDPFRDQRQRHGAAHHDTADLLEFMTPESNEPSRFMRLKITGESPPSP